MRVVIFAAGVAVLLAAPAVASANLRCEREAAGNQAAGTIIGGVAGGAIGNAVTHGSAGGTVAGAIGGAIVGNRLADASTRCPRGYVARYYDDDGRGYAPNAYDYNGDTAYEGYAPSYDRYRDYDDDDRYRGYDRYPGYDRYRSQTWHDNDGRLCSRRPHMSYDSYGNRVQSWTTSCAWTR